MKNKEYTTPEIKVDGVDVEDVVTTSGGGGWTPSRPLNPISDAQSSMQGLLDD